MTRNRSRNTSRAGFTLVELLVVIAIIAILVSLTSAAVMKILGKIPEVQTRTDISQMDASLAAVMSDYSLTDPPPSVLILREDMKYNTAVALELQSLQFLKRMFGKNLGVGAPIIDWNGDGQPNGPWTLEGEQCLVFYMGGIPNLQQVNGGAPPGCQGFSTNNNNPATPGGKRNGPYFNFMTSRLLPGTALNPNLNAFFVYIDAWNIKTAPKPYAYFSSNGVNNSGYATNGLLDCQSIAAVPYRDAGGNFAFSNKYQIISAGKDGVFFTPPVSPTTGVWNPAGGTPGNDADNQVNFSSRLLGAGQQ